ncbi:methyltransferase family protein [Ilumatobacter fluminis]|uniref:Methyltransferase family protein n=1 Tax=Ilumatobacter fluminis TaxID=467091 RepID=A0A4R7I250_9ACTN|nr:class I SAM-dependent methyltransferase [Ilumatobacter fluminis]TDT17667.1 methyltransferase family protein [Ilumatobacter fluminis]
MIEGAADEPTAADRWRDALTAWSLPERVLEAATESPFRHDVARFAVDDTIERESTSARWAREVLPPRGGTVLDVGCGGGRSVAPLIPPATEVIGVDRTGAMLDEFVDAATRAGVARRTVHGDWPDVMATTPTADVAICHHVLFDVADVVPFLIALTARARLAVVVELPVRHPMTAWSEAFEHFWELDRPDGPTHLDLVAVLRELGLDPEYTVSPRRPLSRFGADPDNLVPVARRRLALPADRDGELAHWLAEHPPAFVAEVATIRWPGAADPVGHPIA